MNKDAQMKATINQKLIETGERERYVPLLYIPIVQKMADVGVRGFLAVGITKILLFYPITKFTGLVDTGLRIT